MIANKNKILTNNTCSQKSDSINGRVTFWPKRLKDVIRKGQGYDGISCRHDDYQGHPEVEEGRQRPKGFVDVSIVAT